MLELGTIISALGILGWLIIIKEALQKWNLQKTNSQNTLSDLKVGLSSIGLGRLRFSTIFWNNKEYCIAWDMQNGQMCVVDSKEIKNVNENA
jgi:hypothetical protein